MNKRQEYVKKMHTAMERLKVKAGLAKLELRELRAELLSKYDAVRNQLSELGDATEDRWDATKSAFESAWLSFKNRYEAVMAKYREEQQGAE